MKMKVLDQTLTDCDAEQARRARGPDRGGGRDDQAPRAGARRDPSPAWPLRGTHVLRKTCGTRIADGGGGVAAVATHLRHKNLQTASRYIDRRGAGSRALNALEG